MTHKVIQPEELKKYWSEIKPDLENVLRKTPSATWIIEEVFSMIYTKKMLCVLVFVDNKVDGGFIGHTIPNKTFLVWAGWSKSDSKNGFVLIESFAKRLNCTRVKFETDRMGWEKVAPSLGFRPCSWIKDL